MPLKTKVVFLKVVAVGSLFPETILAFTAARVSEDNMISHRSVLDFGADLGYTSSA